ncbi:MAG: hypothetical protein ACK41D_00390 [Rubricoccaceae bacterium]
MPLLFVLAALLVAGCASSTQAGPVAHPAMHPARPDAPAAARAVPAGALEAVPAPAAPLALRGDASGGHGTGHVGNASGHGASGHGAPVPQASVAASGRLRRALEAYLAVHDALASDDAEGRRTHGALFARAFEAAGLTGDEAATVQVFAEALVAASDLEAARHAFGHLSVPFARLVEAEGLPAGMALERIRCGMAHDLPEQGVWLQRAGDIRNPYFGSAMLACGRRTATLAAPSDAR